LRHEVHATGEQFPEELPRLDRLALEKALPLGQPCHEFAVEFIVTRRQ